MLQIRMELLQFSQQQGNGHSEIVKFLAPLTNNPNAPDNTELTPLRVAYQKGNKEIQRILQKYL